MKKKTNPKAHAENSLEKGNASISPNNAKVLPSVSGNETNENIPYDPKTCIKKRFEDFIPQTLINFSPNNIDQHQVDFYIENRSSILIYESSSSSLPSNMKETYSDFSNSVGNLKFKDTIHTNKEAELLVNSYDSASAEKYVIKKCWHYFDADEKNINIIFEMESFIRNKFNEYSIMKIVNGSPNSVQPIQFHIVYLPKNKYIVTELLMPFGGTPLTEYLHNLTSEEVLDIVKQVTNALDYLDSYNIEHNDIKAGNILVDSILGKRIIRVIDLDIGRNISITNKSTQRTGLTGFTDVYCSPEIYQMVKFPTLYSKTFSSRKSQIYSLGVLILFMCRFFPNDMNRNELDAFKKDKIVYEKFLKIFSDCTKNISDAIKQKLMKIAEICLSFDPDNRLSAKELKKILQDFENKNIDEISNLYSSILSARNKNITNFKTITMIEHENIVNKIKEEFNYKIQEEEKLRNKLIANNQYITNELKIKLEEIEKIRLNEKSMENLLINITDAIKQKLMKIAEICLSFDPDNRLSAKELKKILQDFGNKNIDEISNLYSSIISARNKNITNFKTLTMIEHENIVNKIKEEFNYKIQEEEKLRNKLPPDKLNLSNEGKIKLEDIEKIGLNETIMKNLLIKSNLEVDKIQKNLDEKLKLQIKENQILLKKNESLEKQNEELNFKNIKSEVIIKELSDKVEELEKYKRNYEEDIFQFNNLKKLFEEHKMLDFSQCNSYPQLAIKLYQSVLNFKIQKIKHVKGFNFPENSIYYGPINQDEQPHGPGALIFLNPYRRFIGEFEDGKIKNDLGFLVNERETYKFGKIYNGICENISFIFPEYKKNQGKYYYFGETKNNNFDGKGKSVYSNGDYYEGEFKNRNKEGKGKYVYSEGGYYEGEWKNDKAEGKGKSVFLDGGYYEGEWKNDKAEGKGKSVFPSGDYYEGEFKEHIREGKGKYYVIVSGQIEEIQKGIWKTGLKQGEFLITNSKNQKSTRNYKDDKMI